MEIIFTLLVNDTGTIELNFITYNVNKSVAWITLNNPSSENRITQGMADELRQTLALIDQDDDIRVVALTGAGDVFCAGDEVSDTTQDSLEEARQHLQSLRVTPAVNRLGKPVIAVINGNALGHGLEIALACDIRLASETSKFSFPGVSVGTMPYDGGTQRLPRLIGRARATEMLFTGRVIDAVEALCMGLVHKTSSNVNLPDMANYVTGDLVNLAPIALRYVKEAIKKGMDMTLDQGLRLEADLNIILQTTSDRTEGVASFLERRPPKFTGT